MELNDKTPSATDHKLNLHRRPSPHSMFSTIYIPFGMNFLLSYNGNTFRLNNISTICSFFFSLLNQFCFNLSVELVRINEKYSRDPVIENRSIVT